MEIRYKGKILGSSRGGGASEEIYSTEEVQIGTWIDGKPLYRRTISTTSPSSVSSTTTAITSLPKNVDLVTNLYGILVTEAGWLSLNIYSITLLAQNLDETIRMKVQDSNQVSRPVYLSIEYTKTTDTATISTVAEAASNLVNSIASSPMVSMPITAPFLGEEVENA